MTNFLSQYQESKQVRDLIKGEVFNVKQINKSVYTYDNHDLEFKITHIKKNPKWCDDIIVNVKVCGRMRSWSWNSDSDGMSSIVDKRNYRSSVSRNKMIRQHTEVQVRKYLRLFGIKGYNIEIGKVTVSESI